MNLLSLLIVCIALLQTVLAARVWLLVTRRTGDELSGWRPFCRADDGCAGLAHPSLLFSSHQESTP